MTRSVVIGALLVGVGALAGAFVASRHVPENGLPPAVAPLGRAPEAPSSRPGDSIGNRDLDRWERRLNVLAAQVAREADERRRLQERLDEMAAEIAALGAPASASGETARFGATPESHAAQRGAGAQPAAGSDDVSAADARTATERALIAAGVDAPTVEEIRRRRDELSLAEVYLRDQATREGWLGTPRFNEEMAEIARERVSMREEIGDDAYDRYLAALGHPNRVRVEEVFTGSPAEQAGLQAGDVVLRYGDARIFVPSDLVDETHGGASGESVRIEVLRGAERIAIDVPRGPLGVSVTATAGSGDG